MREILVDFVIPIVAIVGTFGLIILIRWFHHRSVDTRVRTQAELYKLLLNKFASGRELSEFLQTESGKAVFQSLGSVEGNTRTRIQSGLTGGVILTCIGTAMVIAGLHLPGALITAAGIGSLIAAALSYHLSKKWGVVKREPGTPNQ